MATRTHCRFCEINFAGLYTNCPKCGKWLMPAEYGVGDDIEPENEPYEVVE